MNTEPTITSASLDADALKIKLTTLRRQRPLIANVTNHVAMNFTANSLLALGASPIMFHAADEAQSVAQSVSALTLNIGTPDNSQLDTMNLATRVMNKMEKPVVFDPVGAGFTPYRTRACLRILTDNHIDIIKGNASEIIALASRHCLDLLDSDDPKTSGVGSDISPDAAIDAAQLIAQRLGNIVVISGATDIITDGKRLTRLSMGSPLMRQVTATGCTATAIIAAFAAICPDPYEAAIAGMTVVSMAGERAAASSAGPGSFVPLFIDQLYSL